ncbi:MAG: hypothetical protein SF028_11880 [Candidatus Sumerlaeia bacterium]|nr:hypothetical protein [Candidatus Sumerlaeia bacterium]
MRKFAVLLAAFAAAGAASAQTIYVDDNFSNPVNAADPDGAGPATVYWDGVSATPPGADAAPSIIAGHTLAAPGDTIEVADGSYSGFVTITKNGVTINGESNTGTIVQAPVVAGPPAANAALFTVNAQNVTISNFRFVVQQDDVRHGVRSNGGAARFNGLQVLGNVFISNGTQSQSGFPDQHTAIHLQDDEAPNFTQTAIIRGNQIIAGVNGMQSSFFSRGIYMRQGLGTIGGPNPGDGNTIQATFTDLLYQFPTNGPVLVQGNTFNGAGIDFTEPNFAATPLQVLDNTFNSNLNPNNGNPFGLQGLLVKHNYQSRPILVDGNTFNSRNLGFYSGASDNVTISNNTFNVVPGVALGIAHLLVDTDYPGTGISGSFTPVTANDTVIQGNAFNEGTVAGGIGLAFRRGVSAGNTRPMGAMTVGGAVPSLYNSFQDGLAYAVVLDSDTVNAAGGTSPLDAYNQFHTGSYPNPAPGRTVTAFSDDIDVSGNRFEVPSLLPPAAMSGPQIAALNGELWDTNDDAGAGELIFTGLPPVNYDGPSYLREPFAAYDSILLEGTPGSGLGGAVVFPSRRFEVGDDTLNRERRSLIHFTVSTTAATVSSARLRLTSTLIPAPGNNATALGDVLVDVALPTFGTISRQTSDFEASAFQNGVATIPAASLAALAAGESVEVNLDSIAALLPTNGVVQFRLRTTTPSDSDNTFDFWQLASPGYSNPTWKPELILETLSAANPCGPVFSNPDTNLELDPYFSEASRDGRVLSESEAIERGRFVDSANTAILIGDEATNQESRGILSFNTSSLNALYPDAEIVSAQIVLTRQSVAGDPSLLGDLALDMQCAGDGGIFHTTPALQPEDFEDYGRVADASLAPIAVPAANGDTVTIDLNGDALAGINRMGSTQFRVYFPAGTNGNSTADNVRFYSGNASGALRPQLLLIIDP